MSNNEDKEIERTDFRSGRRVVKAGKKPLTRMGWMPALETSEGEQRRLDDGLEKSPTSRSENHVPGERAHGLVSLPKRDERTSSKNWISNSEEVKINFTWISNSTKRQCLQMVPNVTRLGAF